MIWNYPQVKPLIDGRMHMWTDENGYSGFADYYGYEQDRKNINDSKYNVVLMSPYYPVIKRLQKLVGEGKWRQVYQDNGAYIFVRNNPKNNVSKEKTGKAQSAQPPVDKSKKLID